MKDINRTRPDIVVMRHHQPASPWPGGGRGLVGQWQAAGLLKPSAIKPVFATLEQRLVIRRLGTLAPDDRTALRTATAETIG